MSTLMRVNLCPEHYKSWAPIHAHKRSPIVTTAYRGVFVAIVFCLSTTTTSAQPQSADCAKGRSQLRDAGLFFPIDMDEFGPRGRDTADLYSCLLRAMGEEPLQEYRHDAGSSAFRLTVLPVYRSLFVVRLNISHDGTGVLRRKVAKDQNNPNVITMDDRKQVTKAEVVELLKLVGESRFWSMQTNEFYSRDQVRLARNAPPKNQKAERKIMGGVIWLLEGAELGRYHVVDRNSPQPGPYAELTRYVFHKLAGLEVPTLAQGR